jgi:hypothetical protein
MNKANISIILMLFSLSSVACAFEVLSANEWAIPKQADTILAMPAINKSMQIIQNTPSNRLRIRYPGGDEGTLWANELRSWLIALGLSSERIDVVPGSSTSSTIELEVLTHKPAISKKSPTEVNQTK